MADQLGKIDSALQGWARSRGPWGGKLFIKDAVTGGANAGSIYRLHRLVEDFTLESGIGDGSDRMERIRGVSVPMEAIYPERKPRVKFKLGETWDPYSLQLGFGADNTPAYTGLATESMIFAMTLTGTKKLDLPVEYNLVQAIEQRADTVVGTPLATAGTWADDASWFALVVPVENGVVGAYAAGAESAGFATTGGDDAVLIEWALKAGAVEPDYWNIYISATGGSGGAYGASSLLVQVPGSVYAYTSLTGALSSGTPGTGLTPVVVKDETETTTYVADTDYTVDYTNGTIKRIAAGAIGDGQLVVITQYWNNSYKLLQTIDEGRYNSYQVGMLFLGQQSGSTSGYLDNVRIELDKVDITKGADELNAQASLEDAGLEFDFPVHWNQTDGRFGRVSVHDTAMRGTTAMVALT